MRISKIELSNFKRFTAKKEFKFKDYNEFDDSDITLIVGNNGAGKSSLLQAIVVVTATASKEGFDISDFDWPGFEERHIHTGRLPVSIKCTYEFIKEELDAICSYADQLIEIGIALGNPSRHKSVSLEYKHDKKKVESTRGASGYYQFSGYQYAKRLTKYTDSKNTLFDSVGNIYWYTEQRTSYSISNVLDEEVPELDWMRNFLSSAYSFHLALSDDKRELKNDEFDFYEKLHTLFRAVFPERSFVGSAPNFNAYEKVKAPDFFLSDGYQEYEIAEMSAGERAVFPILLDFARWNINNSIIIIDEVELHLHPPLQQAFVRALSKLGKHNQFILTTHSEHVASMFSEEQIIRL
jgi:predicted ATPase